MDAAGFDHLAARLAARLAHVTAQAPTRRGLLAAAAAVLGARLASGPGGEPAQARKKKNKKGNQQNRPLPAGGAQSCVLQTFTEENLARLGMNPDDASNFVWSETKPTLSRPHYDRVDLAFFPTLAAINACAVQSGVKVWVKSAYRNSATQAGTGSVGGAPSPHVVGHAIDWSVEYGAGARCGWTEKTHSGCLGTDPPTKVTPPTPNNRAYAVDPLHWSIPPDRHGVEVAVVRDFIDCVRKTTSPLGGGQKIRWGGEFMPAFKKGKPVGNGYGKQQGFDPIHFDDGISLSKWNSAYAARIGLVADADAFLIAEAKQHGLANLRDCPEEQSCNLATGLCECDDEDACDEGKERDPETCDCVCIPVSCANGGEQDPDTCECEEPVCQTMIRGDGQVEITGVRCGKRCCGPCETCKRSKGKGKKKGKQRCVPKCFADCDEQTGACTECCPPAKREACDQPVEACMVPVDYALCDCLDSCHSANCCQTCPCGYPAFGECIDGCWEPGCAQACHAAWGDGWSACLDAQNCVSQTCGNCSHIRLPPSCFFTCNAEACTAGAARANASADFTEVGPRTDRDSRPGRQRRNRAHRHGRPRE